MGDDDVHLEGNIRSGIALVLRYSLQRSNHVGVQGLKMEMCASLKLE